MPVVDIKTSGTEKLVRLAAAIKASGDKNLQRELRRALQRSAAPLKKSARQGALAILPHRGGLDELIATRSRITSSLITSGRNPGLRIVGNAKRLDDGFVRHPRFGHRGPRDWFDERVTPGWFTKPLILDAPKVRENLDRAMDDVARQLERDGG
jgi:hypothetical protein